MSMQAGLLEKRQEVVARARADLIGHLAYIDIADIFDLDDGDHCFSPAVAHAARILDPEDFLEMVAECNEIACGASSGCYPVNPDVLTGLIYADVQKHAPTDSISRDYCPWWDEHSLFSAHEVSKIIAASAHTRRQPVNSPRESACFVPHRQTGGSDGSDSDGDGDGEPPRPRPPHPPLSPTLPLHHSLTHSLIFLGGAQW